MYDLWQTWVPGRGVREFLAVADIAVGGGVYPDRRAAFRDYAAHALGELAWPHWGPPDAPDVISAAELAEHLLAYAEDAERAAAAR